VGFDIEGDLRITALRPDFAHVWVKLYTETIEKPKLFTSTCSRTKRR